jgi:ribosomal protein S18 acetylase RimI-like enzyme
MRQAILTDRSVVVDLLSHAFEHNKSVNHVVKQDVHRTKRIKRLMEYSFEICYTSGEIWISDDKQSCALLLFPDKNKLSLQRVWLDVQLVFSAVGLNRITDVMKREAKIKNNHPKVPFCHLWFIGVVPEQQHKGKGSVLLQHIIEESRKKKKSIYLETSVEMNLKWYKKFGFEIINTIDLTYTLYQLRLSFS